MKSFFRNKLNEARNVTVKKLYPEYCLTDPDNIKTVCTDYGKFEFSKALQNYPNIFKDVRLYRIADLKRTDIVLDLGAFIGAFTAMVAKKVNQVYALEPLFFEELKKTVLINELKNVKCFPYAVGIENEIQFCWKKELVKSYPLERILKMCDTVPNVLKMDIEGSEWDIDFNYFSEFRAIEAEIHSFRKKNPMDFIENLKNEGFDVEFWIDSNGQFMVSGRK